MAILVIAEHDNSQIKSGTLNTVTAAQKLGSDVHLLVAGAGCAAAADAAKQIAGVSKVLLADAAALAHPLAENLTPLVVDLAKQYNHVLAPATTFGKTCCRAWLPCWMSPRSAKSPQWKAPTPLCARCTPAT